MPKHEAMPVSDKRAANALKALEWYCTNHRNCLDCIFATKAGCLVTSAAPNSYTTLMETLQAEEKNRITNLFGSLESEE